MKLILFDIDGTLITGGAGRRSLGVAFSEVFELEPDAVDQAMRRVTFNGRTDPSIIRDVARELGFEPDRIDDAFERLIETYLRHLDRLTMQPVGRLCPGFPELLDALERRPGVVLGLLTGNIEAGARIKLKPFDLNRWFPAGGFGSDSPDRAAIAATARRKFEVIVGHVIEPRQVLVVGDTIHDVACGRANDFRTLAVTTGGVPLDRLAAAGADLLFENLADVPAVVSAIEELLAPVASRHVE